MQLASLARSALLPALLVLLVLAVFGRAALTSGFVGDDVRFITENPRLAEEGALLRALVDPAVADPENPTGIVRPLRTAEFVLAHRLGGGARTYHLHSVAWHALAAVLLFFLLRALVASRWAALAGAAIWAVHPMQVESVVWISSRGDVAMGACVLGALLLALRSRGLDRWAALSLCVSLVAMLYKETAIVLPLLVFAVRLVRPPGSGRGVAAAARSAWPWALAAGLYWVYRDAVRVGELSHTGYVLGGSVAGTFATMFKAFVAYLWFALLPVRPALEWMLPVSTTLADPVALLCLIVHAVIVGTAVALVRRAPAVSAAVCVFYFALLPVSNWPFRIGIPTTERFLYVPLAGLAILVAAGLAAAGRGGRGRRAARAAIAPAVVVACLAAGSIVRARDWASPEAHQAALLRQGYSPRALTTSAAANAQAGWRLLRLARAETGETRERYVAGGRARLEDALADAIAARAMWLAWAPVGDVPGHAVHRADVAAAFASLGLERHEDAIRYADRALALNDAAARAHYARAWSLLETDRAREAVAAMLSAEAAGLALDDAEYVVFFGRAARAFAADGFVEEALRAYRKALDLGVVGPATDAVARELRALEGR